MTYAPVLYGALTPAQAVFVLRATPELQQTDESRVITTPLEPAPALTRRQKRRKAGRVLWPAFAVAAVGVATFLFQRKTRT